MTGLGALLLLAPADAATLWPWPLTELTAQAIGVFVLAQGALVLAACRERDWDRVRPAMLQYAVLAVLQLAALARFSGTLDWAAPGAWLYLAFLLGVLGMAGYGSSRLRRRSAGIMEPDGRGAATHRTVGRAGRPVPGARSHGG